MKEKDAVYTNCPVRQILNNNVAMAGCAEQ